MGNYFILSHGTMANRQSKLKLINEIHRALGLNNNSVICNDGAGSDLLGMDVLGLSTGPTCSGHDYIQRQARKVVQEMRDLNWDETGTYIFIGFSRGCMLTWQILYEIYYGGEGSSRTLGVNRENVHVLQLDPAYGTLDSTKDYYRELRLGQHYVAPKNVTEIYMLNRAVVHKFIFMYDTPTYVAGVRREFLPGNHEELAEIGLTWDKKLLLFGDGWLKSTSLHPYGRKFVREFLHGLGVTWYNPQLGTDLDWLSMYAQFKLSKNELRGNWGTTSRPKLIQLYDAYRKEHNLGDSGFFINAQDRDLFRQHAKELFPLHHDNLLQVLAWSGFRGDLAAAWLALAAEEYDKLRLTARANIVHQAMCATVIEHLKHRVKQQDWPEAL
jgi:hypothetical protein